MSDAPRIGIIGGGSWATALAKMLVENGNAIRWWIRDKDIRESLKEKGVNPKYLRMVHFDKSLLLPNESLAAVVEESDLLIMAVPAAFVVSAFGSLHRAALDHKEIVSATKGLEPESQSTVTTWIEKTYSLDAKQVAVISGPCHAEEVAQDLTAYLTIGSTNSALSNKVAAALRRPYVRTSTLEDIKGMEYAAVMKNIYAVAAGMATGLNEGDNFRAVLVSAAAREMELFLGKVVPGKRDILHSAYVGDLLVTAYSQHSRNRTFGSMIAHGYTVRSIQLEMNMVAEGYYASKSVWKVCREMGIDLPIADAVYRIIYEKIAPRIEFELLKAKLY